MDALNNIMAVSLLRHKQIQTASDIHYMFVLHIKSIRVVHIYEEDAHKIWGHEFISKFAIGTTTVLLAQASILLAN